MNPAYRTERAAATADYAWYGMARETGVESRINKTNTNNQVRVTWERKEKQTMNSITKLTLAAASGAKCPPFTD